MMKQMMIERAILLSFLIYQDCDGDMKTPFGRMILRSGYGLQWGVIWNDDDRELMIVIRGSDNSQNWFDNFKLFPLWLSGIGLVHRGFRKLAKGVFKLSQHDIYHAYHMGYKICFMGHSLGGIVSQIVEEISIRKHKGLKTESVTIGAPKGFSRFCKIKGDCKRVFIDDDPVPKSPPGLLYQHKEKLCIEGTDPGFVSVSDHSIEKYWAFFCQKKFQKSLGEFIDE